MNMAGCEETGNKTSRQIASRELNALTSLIEFTLVLIYLFCSIPIFHPSSLTDS